MKKYFNLVIPAAISIFLTACASLLTSNDNVQYFYVLNPIDDEIHIKTPADVNLVVQDIDMPEWLDTQHIILRKGNNKIDYYAQARWASASSRMLTELIAESLIANRVTRSVSSSGNNINANYLLVVEVSSFEARYTSNEKPPLVEVALQAKLIALPSQIVHYQFNVKNTTQAKSNTLSAVVAAFDSSTQACLTELVERTAHGLAVK